MTRSHRHGTDRRRRLETIEAHVRAAPSRARFRAWSGSWRTKEVKGPRASGGGGRGSVAARRGTKQVKASRRRAGPRVCSAAGGPTQQDWLLLNVSCGEVGPGHLLRLVCDRTAALGSGMPPHMQGDSQLFGLPKDPARAAWLKKVGGEVGNCGMAERRRGGIVA